MTRRCQLERPFSETRRSKVLRFIEVLAIVTATVIALISLKIACDTRHPSTGPILKIIETEAVAVLNRDIDRAVSLFAEDAFVRDFVEETNKKLGLVPLNVPTSWAGLSEIRERYVNLPIFTKLHHDGVVVTFDDTGKFARATASTNGRYVPQGQQPVDIFSVDGERWTFKKIGSDWKITSFTYNLP